MSAPQFNIILTDPLIAQPLLESRIVNVKTFQKVALWTVLSDDNVVRTQRDRIIANAKDLVESAAKITSQPA